MTGVGIRVRMAFERVYTVWDYWDGPRSGIAEYRGQAHHFRCEWNEIEDDYAETFVLAPIGQEMLTLAMDQLAIWRDWESAFHRGEVPQSTHPALADPRYNQLEGTIRDRISSERRESRRAVPVFRTRPGQASAPPGVIRELKVEWTDIED
jgi:hypothetical protein